jgi:hypothetical protein
MIKKIWLGFGIFWHFAVEILLFVLIGAVAAEYFDSTLIGTIIAFVALGTRLILVFKIPIMFVTLGLPNILFCKLGWLQMEDLS